MSNVYREGMDLPNNDDMTPSSRKPPRRAPKPVAKPQAKPKVKPFVPPERMEPTAKELAAYEREKAEKRTQRLTDEAYEKALTTPADYKCGGKVKKYAGGGMMSEYGGREKYANKAMQRQHERAESPAKERMEKKSGVRGGGIAKRGVGKGRMC